MPVNIDLDFIKLAEPCRAMVPKTRSRKSLIFKAISLNSVGVVSTPTGWRASRPSSRYTRWRIFKNNAILRFCLKPPRRFQINIGKRLRPFTCMPSTVIGKNFFQPKTLQHELDILRFGIRSHRFRYIRVPLQEFN